METSLRSITNTVPWLAKFVDPTLQPGDPGYGKPVMPTWPKPDKPKPAKPKPPLTPVDPSPSPGPKPGEGSVPPSEVIP